MAQSRLAYLFDRHLDRTISVEERQELFRLMDDPTNDADLQELIDGVIAEPGSLASLPGESGRAILEVIFAASSGETGDKSEMMPGQAPVLPLDRRRRRRNWTAAAVLILLAGTATWFALLRRDVPGNVSALNKSPVAQDVTPGGNKAILTLADGSRIVLDSAKNGVLSQQGNAQVIKTNSGQLAYTILNEDARRPVFNTISTPLRGQYEVVLPDGTRVWLNALSSLRYPTAFTGRQRQVELTGEAYFEVAKNEQAPFIVTLVAPAGQKAMQVEVLGTEFNLMGYGDEPAVKTTLVGGVVKVSKAGKSVKLGPGQQAQLNLGTGSLQFVQKADVDKAVAWRKGNFQFGGDDIEAVMRQLARWYGIEVKYETEKPKVHYSGEISRNLNLSKVLNMLALSGLRVKLEGNSLTVLP